MTYDKAYLDSLARVLKSEGLYSDDKLDSGGETFKGISRNNFPKWEGWVIIDELKSKTDFKKLIAADTKLNSLVEAFYYKEFWVKVGGDKVENVKVSGQNFDTAINMGVGPALKFSQSVFGLKQTGVLSQELIDKLNTVT